MLKKEFVLDIDYKRYTEGISRALQHFYHYPQGVGFIKLRKDGNGEIVGWEIDNEKCEMSDCDNFLRVDEAVKKHRDGWHFNFFTYHFQPDNNDDVEPLHQYRIDLDKTSLHANPDDLLEYPPHMEYPEHLILNIEKFNLAAALYCANHYQKTKKYPLKQEYGEEYNGLIETTYKGVKR